MRANCYPLRSADVLIKLFDDVARSRQQLANVCGMELAFDFITSTLRARLESNQYLRELASLSFARGFCKQSWRRSLSQDVVKLLSKEEFFKLQDASYRSKQVSLKRPFALFVLDQDREARVFAVWHHALFDALGMQNLLLTALSGEKVEEGAFFKDEKRPSVSEMFAGRKVSMKLLKAPFASCKETHLFQQLHIDFSSKEVGQIFKRRDELQLGLFPGVFYQSVVARAFAVLETENTEAVLILAPRTMRKKKSRFVLGNLVNLNVSRVSIAGKTLSDLAAELLDSSYRSVQDGSMRSMADFQAVFKYLPSYIASRLLLYPGAGRMASVYVSCLEAGKAMVSPAAELACRDIRHYPPNFYPSGLSVVFHVFEDRLRVIVSSILATEQTEAFAKRLKELLIGVEE